jgi:hypothetical protein
MKTTKELLQMSGNDLIKYCESLKYFKIDKTDFTIYTVYDIKITKIVYDKIHKRFSVWFRFENSGIYDEDSECSINTVIHTYDNKLYKGLFESEQDAIDMAKQDVKKEILEQINDYKQQIKELEKKIESLENL